MQLHLESVTWALAPFDLCGNNDGRTYVGAASATRSRWSCIRIYNIAADKADCRQHGGVAYAAPSN